MFPLSTYFHPAHVFTQPIFSFSLCFHSAYVFTHPMFSLSTYFTQSIISLSKYLYSGHLFTQPAHIFTQSVISCPEKYEEFSLFHFPIRMHLVWLLSPATQKKCGRNWLFNRSQLENNCQDFYTTKALWKKARWSRPWLWIPKVLGQDISGTPNDPQIPMEKAKGPFGDS